MIDMVSFHISTQWALKIISAFVFNISLAITMLKIKIKEGILIGFAIGTITNPHLWLIST